MDIEKKIREIESEAADALRATRGVKDVEQIKVKYLGKKGKVQEVLTTLKEAPSDARPHLGKLINDLKTLLTDQIEKTLRRFEMKEINQRLSSEAIDVTLPGRWPFQGGSHVLLAMLDEVVSHLVSLGFSVQYGPEIESEYYNFEALNFPKDHPARDMHDTFYISSDMLLRTHTSNTQVRVMEGTKPPIRVVAFGKCYRNEDISSRSHVVFHQIEALYVDKSVALTDLIDILEKLLKLIFKKEIPTRYRPSYFPFVEPGMEVDIHCIVCGGQGCSVCKRTGWLEVAGAGMVHPEVLKNGGIDPEENTGYAFSFGIERLTMLMHGIKDIRLFLENDLRFLRQF